MEDKKLLLLKEIHTQDLGTVYSPTTREIIEFTDTDYNKLLLPFMLTMDDFEFNKEVISNIELGIGREFTIFDYLVSNTSTLNDIINSLKFFYKTKFVEFKSNCVFVNCNLIGDKLIEGSNPVIISHFNWKDLCEIIRKMMWLTDTKKEERQVTVEHEENNEILQEYLRLRKMQEEENKRLAEKDSLTLHDIVTIVASGCSWDYDRVLDMTYYRLINSYRAIMSIDNYETNLKYHTSYKFDTSNMKIEHWTDSIKKG